MPAARSLGAGFLLAHLGGTAARGKTAIGDPTYSDFADPSVAIGKLETVDPATVEIDTTDPVTRLLRS